MKQKDKTMNMNSNNKFKPGTLILRFYKNQYNINFIVLKIFVKNGVKLCRCLCNSIHNDGITIHEFSIGFDFRSIRGFEHKFIQPTNEHKMSIL